MSLETLPSAEKDTFKIVTRVRQIIEFLNNNPIPGLPVSVANGGTGQTTEAEAIGELIQALSADATPDWLNDYVPSYDASADTGKKLLLSTVWREKLLADRTYYVRTDGSDSNNGLTNSSGGAFLTIQKAVDVAAAIDSSIYIVTIQVGNGTYTAPVTLRGLLGSGYMNIKGDTSAPSNVVISTTSATCFTINSGTKGIFYLQGMRLQTTTSGHGIINNSNVGILWFDNLDFGALAAGHNHLQLSHCEAFATGPYSISGSAVNHIFIGELGYINTAGRTVTITNTPAFSTSYINVGRGSLALANGMTFSGSATGVRFIVAGNSHIHTNGGGASYFPGDSAGSGDPGTFDQYT